MVNIGDKVMTIKTSNGERVAIPLATPAVGDKVLMMRTTNGERVAVPLGHPSVGDKVLAYRLSTGEFVCLFPGGGGSGGGDIPITVMPPGNFSALRTGPSTADLDWLLGEGNDAVRIVRRTDRYPTSITDGVVAYEGAGSSAEDSGLDYRQGYYYSAWGRAGSKCSNGYLTDRIGAYGSNPPGTYYLSALSDYAVGAGGTASSFVNCLGNNSSYTYMGYQGWLEARFDSIDLALGSVVVTIGENTGGLFQLTLNPLNYIYPNFYTWDVNGINEIYQISFILPRTIRIYTTNGAGYSGVHAFGNIMWVKAIVP